MKRFLKALLALVGVVFVVLVLLLLWPLPNAPQNGVAGDFLIRDVDIVDVRNGTLTRAQDVLVVGGTIDTIAPAGTIAAPASVRVIRGDGRVLLPGLWDMHTHSPKLAGQYYHPLLIANGVTGVREMWGCMSEPDGFRSTAATRCPKASPGSSRRAMLKRPRRSSTSTPAGASIS